MIKRDILENLKKWKNSDERKPLVMKGIRQSGKTSLLKKFGEECFESCAYFNFEEMKNISELFKGDMSAHRIIDTLSILHGRAIVPGKTLIILDEIQECNEVLNSLKYFYEDMPGLHIASAGSLIGITLSKPASFPVGKVNFMTLHPLSLKEFIYASGEELLADTLSRTGADYPIPKALFDKYSDMLKYYFIVGGMPEAAAKWIEYRDIEKTEVILSDILSAYELDFAKHAPIKDIQKIREIWDSIPNQLARENKKFVYTAVRSGARAREYEDAVNWLKDAGLIYKIYNISKPNLPLSAYSDSSSFKIYMADTGLLRVKSKLPATVFLGDDHLFTEFKGAISESFVLSEIISSGIDQPYYWTSNAAAEVEFIIQQGTDIVPVEVKSGTNVRSKSLDEYRKRYNPEKAIRMSMKNIGIENGLLSLPLFMASEIKRFQ